MIGSNTAQLKLLTFSDLHGQMRPREGGQGGVARLAGAIRKLKDEDTLVLDCGDNVSGDAVCDMFKGEPIVKAQNHMPIDAAVLGNHNFDYGPESLHKNLADTKHTTLATNVFDESGQQLNQTESSKVVTLGNGMKVGIVGLLTDQMEQIARQPLLTGFAFGCATQALKKELGKLRKQDVDTVVVLTHQSKDEDVNLAKQFPGEGLIFCGGHDHDPLDLTVEGNRIIKPTSHGETLAQVTLDIDRDKKAVTNAQTTLLDVNEQLAPEDAKVARIVKRYEQSAGKKLETVLGEIAGDLEHAEDGETTLGKFVARAVKGPAEVGVFNSRGIRSQKLTGGKVRLKDALEVFPFESTKIVEGRVKGADLVKAMEASEQSKDGNHLQVSGITTCYKADTVRYFIQGEEVKHDGEYRVRTNELLAEGALGYGVLKNANWSNDGMSFSTAVKAKLDYDAGQHQPFA